MLQKFVCETLTNLWQEPSEYLLNTEFRSATSFGGCFGPEAIPKILAILHKPWHANRLNNLHFSFSLSLSLSLLDIPYQSPLPTETDPLHYVALVYAAAQACCRAAARIADGAQRPGHLLFEKAPNHAHDRSNITKETCDHHQPRSHKPFA